MTWPNVALGEIFDFSNGVNFDKSAYGTGVKLIGVSNFGNRFSPDFDELQEIDEAVVRTNDYLTCGDIVFVRSNGNKELVGRCMLISEVISPVTYSGFCIRARIKNNRHDPRFFTYYFKTQRFRKAISGSAVGSNIQNLSQGRLVQHVACVPDLSVQRRIADILSAYDDLIGNNQKQIKLLEEAAQRLYREWFVELRFPGHETVPVVNGVPEGWEVKKVADLSATLRRGISPVYNDKAATRVINQKCIRQTIVDYSESRMQEKAYPEELALRDSDTVICSTGAGTLGRVGQIHGECPDTTLDSHVTLVRANASTGKQFLFWSLKAQQAFFMGAGKGSTNQLELSRETIGSLEVLVPTNTIMCAFEQYAQGIHDKQTACTQQNILLKDARDRLLPKLMSGEVEV